MRSHEAALKIKEGSCVHAKAFLAGEPKHGPLVLVADGIPSMLFAMSFPEATAASTTSHEIMSRGGYTIGVGPFEAASCDRVVHVPDLGDATIFLAVVIAQRIGYEAAFARSVDLDYPRNLRRV